jgi:transketolase
MSAAHYRLGNLVAIIDRNELSLDGRVQDVMSVEPIQDKFAAFGWDTVRIDGHDLHAIRAALDAAPAVDEHTPTVIVADTIKGRGVPFMEGDADWHMGGLGPEDRDRVLTALLDPDQADYRRGRR